MVSSVNDEVKIRTIGLCQSGTKPYMKYDLLRSHNRAPISSPLGLPPVPYELRLVPVVGLEQGGADGIWQARVVEPDAEIDPRTVAAGACLLGITDTGPADEHPEHRRILVVAVVVRDQPQLRVYRQGIVKLTWFRLNS
jgi:hypothetical protein